MVDPVNSETTILLADYKSTVREEQIQHSRCGRFCFPARGIMRSRCAVVSLFAAYGFVVGGIMVSAVSLAVVRIFFIPDGQISIPLPLLLKIMIPSCVIPGVCSGLVGYCETT